MTCTARAVPPAARSDHPVPQCPRTARGPLRLAPSPVTRPLPALGAFTSPLSPPTAAAEGRRSAAPGVGAPSSWGRAPPSCWFANATGSLRRCRGNATQMRRCAASQAFGPSAARRAVATQLALTATIHPPNPSPNPSPRQLRQELREARQRKKKLEQLQAWQEEKKRREMEEQAAEEQYQAAVAAEEARRERKCVLLMAGRGTCLRPGSRGRFGPLWQAPAARCRGQARAGRAARNWGDILCGRGWRALGSWSRLIPSAVLSLTVHGGASVGAGAHGTQPVRLVEVHSESGSWSGRRAPAAQRPRPALDRGSVCLEQTAGWRTQRCVPPTRRRLRCGLANGACAGAMPQHHCVPARLHWRRPASFYRARRTRAAPPVRLCRCGEKTIASQSARRGVS